MKYLRPHSDSEPRIALILKRKWADTNNDIDFDAKHFMTFVLDRRNIQVWQVLSRVRTRKTSASILLLSSCYERNDAAVAPDVAV